MKAIILYCLVWAIHLVGAAILALSDVPLIPAIAALLFGSGMVLFASVRFFQYRDRQRGTLPTTSALDALRVAYLSRIGIRRERQVRYRDIRTGKYVARHTAILRFLIASQRWEDYPANLSRMPSRYWTGDN